MYGLQALLLLWGTRGKTLGTVDIHFWKGAAAAAVSMLTVTAIALIGTFEMAQSPPNIPTNNQPVTISTGNTFQQILAATPNYSFRRSLTIQNNNASDTCWISFGVISGTVVTAGNAAKGSSIELLPGGSYQRYQPFVPSDAFVATCTTTGDTIYVDTQ